MRKPVLIAVAATLASSLPIAAASEGIAPAFSADELTALPTGGWITNGGNIFNQRYSPLDQINRDNVQRLKGVWRHRLDGSGSGPQHSGEAQPIVYDGVVYIVTGNNDVFAIGVDSGRRLWKYEAKLDPDIATACCSWTNRGVALGHGRIFLGQLDGKLVALDQQTGDVVWSVQSERWQEGYTITSAPLYYDGMVITGFAGAEFGTRGRIKAYDAADGSLLWTFYTIPEPGQPGSETWPAGNDAWRYGGGSVWQTPAADPDLGLIFFATGNPGPDFNGSERAGDNLYTSSVIALEASTGELRWYFQTVHHDLWDYDAANPVVLFDAEVEGRARKGIAAASKTSWVYILDRTDGTPLIGIEERPVPQEPRQKTSATQPFPLGDAITPQRIDVAPEGFSLVNQGRIFTPYWDLPVVVALGGMNWPPSSYDPRTHTMYLCARDRMQIFKTEEAGEFEEGKQFLGGGFDFVELPTTGYFAALDVTTNKLVWRQHWGQSCYSGSAVTAGGLVFVGRSDGRLLALDSSDGSHLWEFQTGAGVNAPASVFEHEGRQHVVVYSAGNLFARSVKGDSVWLFALHGTMDPVEPGRAAGPAIADSAAALAGLGPADADLDAGARIYNQVCAFCHADTGIGGHDGVPLDNATDAISNARIIYAGRDRMPAFGSVYTPEEIRDLGAYVAKLAGMLKK